MSIGQEKVSFEVIGGGFGRTGTSSLKKALEILGLPCYHMDEVFANRDRGDPEFWIRATNGMRVDFNEIYGRKDKPYKASCDCPSSLFWKEQLKQYPNAKVILTLRDPERWYQSCCETIFNRLPSGPFSGLGANLLLIQMGVRDMLAQVQVRDFFHNDLSKENAINCYNEHNQRVINECPKEKLFIFEIKEGWEPLCKFLNLPVPNVPFPNVNDSKEFQKHVRHAHFVGYVSAVVIGLLSIGLTIGVTGVFNTVNLTQGG